MQLPNLNEAKKRGKSETLYVYDKLEYKIKFNGKYYLRTYGCQMNEHDSEAISNILENMGFIRTDVLGDADVIILNTCAVRENVHNKVFGFLGRCKNIKERNKNVIIGICGCMAQEEVVCKIIMEKYSYIDIVFGTHNIYELKNMIEKRENKLNINVKSIEGNVYENMDFTRENKYQAYVTIMYGCDKFCTYCIVPYTRGHQRSRKSKDIIEEINELVSKGYQEVTLLGQNVNAYGKDCDNELKFSELLKEVAKTNIPRIRFVTSHPWDFNDDMLDVISEYSNIMPYIHLPLQSGSSRILKLMGRRYTKEEYLELVNKIRKRIPNVAISTDIIVGFPNESEEDFNDTLDAVDKVKYDGAFTFIYSKRVGTPAANMDDNVSKEIKEERLQRLNDKVNQYSNGKNQEYLNKVVKVLLTDYSKKDKSRLSGYTETMKLVNVIGDKSNLGKIVNVKIIDTKSFSMIGEII